MCRVLYCEREGERENVEVWVVEKNREEEEEAESRGTDGETKEACSRISIS